MGGLRCQLNLIFASHHRGHMKSIHRLCVAVTVMLIAGPSWAGTRRHDVADSVHTDLANESQFDSVGTFLAGNSLCGATLITGDWAITAAHCGSVGSVADMTFEIDGILHEVGVSQQNLGRR